MEAISSLLLTRFEERLVARISHLQLSWVYFVYSVCGGWLADVSLTFVDATENCVSNSGILTFHQLRNRGKIFAPRSFTHEYSTRNIRWNSIQISQAARAARSFLRWLIGVLQAWETRHAPFVTRLFDLDYSLNGIAQLDWRNNVTMRHAFNRLAYYINMEIKIAIIINFNCKLTITIIDLYVMNQR